MKEEVQQWVMTHMAVNEWAPTDEPEFSDHGYSVNVLLDLIGPDWRKLVKSECEKCSRSTHRDDAFNRRCNGCTNLVLQCICDPVNGNN